jgi:hypothetical protein
VANHQSKKNNVGYQYIAMIGYLPEANLSLFVLASTNSTRYKWHRIPSAIGPVASLQHEKTSHQLL